MDVCLEVDMRVEADVRVAVRRLTVNTHCPVTTGNLSVTPCSREDTPLTGHTKRVALIVKTAIDLLSIQYIPGVFPFSGNRASRKKIMCC